MTDTTVTEIARFRLNPGTDRQAFLAAARGLAPFLDRSGGFLERHLSEGSDGVWTDHLVWASMADAERAAAAIARAPEAQAFMAPIDLTSVEMRHEVLRLSER